MRLKIGWNSVPFLLLAACNSNPGKSNKPDMLASNLDTTVNPADDFFEYANGGWIKKNPIPSDESGWGLFQVIPDETLNRLKDINDEAAKNTAAKGSAEQKISDFWKAAMDSVNIEEKGIKLLQPYLDKIAAINDVKNLQTTMAELSLSSLPPYSENTVAFSTQWLCPPIVIGVLFYSGSSKNRHNLNYFDE